MILLPEQHTPVPNSSAALGALTNFPGGPWKGKFPCSVVSVAEGTPPTEAVSNYSVFLVDPHSRTLYVGARNAILALALESVSNHSKMVSWKVPEHHRVSCTMKGKKERVSDFQDVERQESGRGKCPFEPMQPSAAVMADGVLYAATVNNFLGTEPIISRATGNLEERIRTETSVTWLNDPDFVASAFLRESETGDADKIYFFFTETAREYDFYEKVKVPRVARVCKGDLVGLKTLQKRWTTFLKTQLVCSDPESGTNFNLLKDVFTLLDSSNWTSTVFYGIFSCPTKQQGLASPLVTTRLRQVSKGREFHHCGELGLPHLGALLSSLQNWLYVGSSSEVTQVNTTDCGRYRSCQDCVLGRDPACGWSRELRACIDHQGQSGLIQDITSVNILLLCPKATQEVPAMAEMPVILASRVVLPCLPQSAWSSCEWSCPPADADTYTQRSDGLEFTVTEETLGEYTCRCTEAGAGLVVASYSLVKGSSSPSAWKPIERSYSVLVGLVFFVLGLAAGGGGFLLYERRQREHLRRELISRERNGLDLMQSNTTSCSHEPQTPSSPEDERHPLATAKKHGSLNGFPHLYINELDRDQARIYLTGVPLAKCDETSI
uniref:Ssemaphorin 4F n=1 Tax=Sphenodon punctatus TaxID=8508 RepID=A0A8D0GF67_SPHPU